MAYESERDERELPPGVLLHGAAKRNSVSYMVDVKDPVRHISAYFYLISSVGFCHYIISQVSEAQCPRDIVCALHRIYAQGAYTLGKLHSEFYGMCNLGTRPALSALKHSDPFS